MFGLDMNTLIFMALAALAFFAVALTFLLPQISNERNQEKKINSIKHNERDRDARLKAEARVADASKRKQSVQNSLKELEAGTKAKDPNKQGLKDTLRQAGIDITIPKFYVFSVIFGIIFSIIVLVASGDPLVAGAGLIIGILGIPRWYVGRKRKKRMNAFLMEFPNAVDVITRGIKAGLPLNDCLGIIATEAKEPVRTEFKRVLETQQMGVPMTEAILKLYKNVPLTEANFFGIVISIQQSAGGNLSEALGNLSKVLRDRKKMKAKIVAMSSEAKASAMIIGALPIVVTVLIYITTPKYITTLFIHETGHLILLGSAAWMFMGIMVMKSMINFDF
ncbi:MAG: type II secretion system F family protein [Rhizobiaceae bacterium]|nr:type II secretion system F family protein [Rhizobiaceae bacterium]